MDCASREMQKNHQTPVMDEFLEDIFAMPWDYNAGQGAMMMERAGTGAAMAGVEAASNINHNSNIGGSSSMAAATQQQQKMFSMPLIQQQPRLLNNNNNGSGALSGVNQAQLVSSQASQLSSQQQQQGKEFQSSRILGSGPTSAPSGQGFPGSSQQGLPTVGVRPRVRARRGQATDPHSIAERLRRERIAERMKALQELVPNSNKTDKASMLDEIIDYVKFLQLQVKILSMSRLGGAGAVASTASDHPAEGSNTAAATISRSLGTPTPVQDGIALTERQVTRLMEDDMGSAMQYLQSKGLCLMPIALATAISTTNSRGSHTATVGAGDRQKATAAGSSGGPAADGLVSEQSSKDNNREVESTNGTTTSMPIAKAPKGEGKPSDGP
ncbi:unnamed protein product [Sphagnum jensenii]|uniref:BHLH domain-containing protein n=1 Tax=Sphagnum jensenii TaxID=128206 RepID=A0ABP1BA06_9BRYO